MDIKPTRSELMKLKKRITLAKSGHNLLKKKRDGLVIEFFEIMKRAKTVRKELTEAYKTAQYKLDVASALEGAMQIKSNAMTVNPTTPVDISPKNIMGVVVPRIAWKAPSAAKISNGYARGSIAIDETIESYDVLISKIVTTAEVETAMLRLLNEIEKTKRRVNALEFSIIPRMRKQAKFVTLRLEEMERENIFRLKRIKKKVVAA